MTASRSYAGLPASERRENRRAALIAAATRVYGEVGYAKATVRAICHEAGLTERYFYESFTDKDDLLAAAFTDATQGLATIMRDALAGQRDAEQRLRAVLGSYYARLREDGPGAKVFLAEIHGVSPAIDALFDASIQDLADGLIEIIPSMADVPLLARLGLAGAIVQIALSWIRSGYMEPIEAVVDAAALTFRTWLDQH